ncbi:MAG: hypothetical protein Q9159_003408 [Coniocarpon cinnabarinum]
MGDANDFVGQFRRRQHVRWLLEKHGMYNPQNHAHLSAALENDPVARSNVHDHPSGHLWQGMREWFDQILPFHRDRLTRGNYKRSQPTERQCAKAVQRDSYTNSLIDEKLTKIEEIPANQASGLEDAHLDTVGKVYLYNFYLQASKNGFTLEEMTTTPNVELMDEVITNLLKAHSNEKAYGTLHEPM